ncbi:hypothetical protein [Ornithinimicrobium tianjinense]|uniref:Uncharacterized protein n=1 Tax=Ornithinimicrobium tianjinense TaxID=1195761 RepID=A0A917BGB0_9MICO|nr:hypothetical protein [Ornithinimicrobium tianjinense]GGF43200.1 hypothetical protein GCM10011366_08820 [Ornithinimicrobium tianjinense]
MPQLREPTTPTSAAVAALVDDLQGTAADLGWSQANGLVDALIDSLAHLLVDAAAQRPQPGPHPQVVGAIGGPDGPLDHASCRTASSALRRTGAALLRGSTSWAPGAGEVALDLADLLEECVEQERLRRLRPGAKSVVVRRLLSFQRRLHGLT